MEIHYQDQEVCARNRGNKEKIRNLVHANIGMASVVTVSDVPEKQAFSLKTATGTILCDYAFTRCIEKTV